MFKYYFIIVSILYIISFIFPQVYSKEYQVGDRIPFIASKVWPRRNPSESYSYFSLPVCPEDEDQSMISQSYFDDITGSRNANTLYEINFMMDVEDKLLCILNLDKDAVNDLIHAIKNQYFGLFYFDSLPVKFALGMVDVSETRYFFNTHLIFKLTYRDNHVISVDAIPDKQSRVELIKDTPLKVTNHYSVIWKETSQTYQRRMDRYIDMRLFPEELEIQWFSILNSIVLVIVLSCFLIFIIRRLLSRDYTYYLNEDTDDGWKLLHGDVFRYPRFKNIFAAVIGNGSQMLTLCLFVLILATLGAYYPDYSNRAFYGSLLIIYCLSTGISGFMSANYYKKFGGKHWKKNILVATLLYIGPMCVMWAILNTISIFYASSAAFPFKVIIFIVGTYALVSFPLQLLGGFIAKQFSSELNAPCRTKQFPRQIPPMKWYRNGLISFLISGLLPFSAIVLELRYIFKSMWGFIVYTPYPILILVFILLICVTSCVSITGTYMLISHENHEWWWRSILNGGAVSFYIFGYAVYFFMFESQMHGFLQFAFYFGYMSAICFAFFLMMGTVSFLSSLTFLMRIYRGLKTE